MYFDLFINVKRVRTQQVLINSKCSQT